MKRVLLLPAAAAVLAGGFWAAVGVAGGQASAKKSGHVTICHRTGSHQNPYVVISPSVSGVYHGHYLEHNEHAVFPNTASDGKWGDIIPPFQYQGVTYSLNWDAQGQAIWSNGCRPVTSGTTGTTSTTGTTNTTGTTSTVTSTVTTSISSSTSTVTVTTPSSTVTVTTTGPLTPPPPPHKKHHHRKKHRQKFTPPNVKLPHTT
jgi:hypothetical protein